MAGPKTEVLFLSKQDVDRLITFEDVVTAVEGAFRSDGEGQMLIPPKELMPMGGANALFAMPGCLYNLGVAGVKWTNFYPQGQPGIPTIWAHVLVLSHVANGQPFAILDATTITGLRTAGGHAVVAARHLARKNARTLGVLGCGAQGRAGVRSFDRHFQLDKVVLYDANPAAAEAMRAELAGEVKAPLVCADDPQAPSGCDMVLCVTTSLTPVVQEAWLKPGCFVAAMFGFNDVDPAFSFKADRWVIGQRSADGIEILNHPAYGAKLDLAGPDATLGEVICGSRPGRQSNDERIVFTHMGMASLDIAVGVRLVEKARAEGLGQLLRLT